MTEEEVKAKALKVSTEIDSLKSLVSKAATSGDLDVIQKGLDAFKLEKEADHKKLMDLETALKTQGETMQGLVNMKGELIGGNKSIEKEFMKAFRNVETIAEIDNIRKTSRGEANILTIKAVGEITTGAATATGTIPAISHIVNSDEISEEMYRGSWLDPFMSVSSISRPFWSYTERQFKEGAATHVAEGATKPQIDLSMVTRYATPYKVAAYEIFTEESLQDIPGLEDYARTVLRGEVDYEYTTKVLKGAGSGEDPNGIITQAPAASVPTGLANTVPSANLYDVIMVLANQVATAKGEKFMPHIPNLAMVNPIDMLSLQLAKDENNNYIVPLFNTNNGTLIGNITVQSDISIPAGTVVVGDFKKANVKRYIDYNVRLGYINAQLISNKITMVGEKRYMFYIKNMDSTAFVKASIATIKANLDGAVTDI